MTKKKKKKEKNSLAEKCMKRTNVTMYPLSGNPMASKPIYRRASRINEPSILACVTMSVSVHVLTSNQQNEKSPLTSSPCIIEKWFPGMCLVVIFSPSR